MGLVRSFQISAVFPHLTVLDNVRVALQRPNGLATQFWQPMSALDRLNARADELIDAVGLDNASETPSPPISPTAASACWRSRRRWRSIPKVLLLDEPMAGMGQEDVGMVADIIREVARTAPC